MDILSDKNISAKEFDKLLKYKELEEEIAKMQDLNTTTITIIEILRITDKSIDTH